MKTRYFGVMSLWILFTAVQFSQNSNAQNQPGKVKPLLSETDVINPWHSKVVKGTYDSASLIKTSQPVQAPKKVPQSADRGTPSNNFDQNNLAGKSSVTEANSAKGSYGSWLYYNPIAIDNTSNPNTLSDYSVLVIVNTYDLIAAGKMIADGSDIRFTTDFTDNLSYWIDPGIQNEYGANTTATHIWVKVPTINAASSTTINLVYGNPSAGAESNIATTFLLGDDFNDNSIDASKWNVIYTNAGQIYEQNQRLEHHSPATNPESEAYVQSIQSFTEPVVLDMQLRKGGYVYRTVGLSMESTSWTNSSVIDFQDYGLISVNTNVDGVTTGSSYSDQYWSTTYDPEYYLSITRKPDGMFHYSVNVPATQPGGPLLWENDIVATMPLTTPLNVFTRDHVWYNASGLQSEYEDNIRIRKYSSPEPNTSLSGEQVIVTTCTPSLSSYSCQYMWITNVTTSGGVTDFNNTTGCSANSYEDFSSSYNASNYQGATTTLSFSSATDYSYPLAFSVWIDFDGNGTFSGTEQVIANSNSGAAFTFTDAFTVPATVTPGTYKMRVRSEYYSYGAPVDACTTLQYGETEDYGFTVLANSAHCIPPTSTIACSMWISNFSTSGGVTDFNNSTSCSGNSYDDYSSTYIASNYPGAVTTVSFSSYNALFAYSVWIDFNDDNIFDASELVITNPNSLGYFTISSTFTVPASAPIGTHKMRVRGEYSSMGVPTDPCSQLYYGETEDYGFTVLSSQPSTINLTFNVNMSQPINVGDFVPGIDVLYVTGNFANVFNPTGGWDMPGTGESFILTDDDNDKIYTGTVAIDINYGELKYKYFKNASWDYGDNVTGDRIINIGTADYTTNDVWIYPAERPTAVINRATTAPTIDGFEDAVWSGANIYNIDKPFGTETPTLGVSGTTTWKGLWTDEGIYLLVQVNDDVFSPVYYGSNPSEPWYYDKPEIYFDVNPTLEDGYGPSSVSSGHHQFAPSPIEGEIGGGSPGTGSDGNGCTYAWHVTDPGYVVEYFIPFTKLLDNNLNQVLPTATMGFDVTVIDNDDVAPQRSRAVWANRGALNESYSNMDQCGTITLGGAGTSVFVSTITVSAEGDVTSINTENGTLQMYASILPLDATIQTVKWSVISGTGKASIDANGLLTAQANGTVTVRATAIDGSGVYGNMQVTITNQVVTLSDLNIIKDGGFATDGPISAPWTWYSDNGGTANVIGGVCTMVPGAVDLFWHLQVNQLDWVAEKDTTYVLTFTAWANANRTFTIDFEDNNNYNRFGASSDADAVSGRSEWNVAITTTPTVYKRYVTFDQLEATTTTKFNIMTSASIETVYIDDISVVSLGGWKLLNASTLFAGGSGTESDPYQIATAEQLNNVRQLLGVENSGVYFKQIANIDLGVSPWADGKGWEPIGNSTSQFYGNYDGNWNTINGLTINRPDSNYVALFGYAKEASFKNIRLDNVNILGNQRVAPLVARLQTNGYVSNCYASGNVSGQLFTSGLIGNLTNGSTLENSYSSVNVTMIDGSSSHQQAGGLVARLAGSTINNCFATGTITGIGSWFGGLIGLITDNSMVNNSYATGDIKGDSFIGGLIGEADNSSLVNCYSVGRVSGYGGGLVGTQLESTASGCFWNTETSTQTTSALGMAKNAYQLVYTATFGGWDFGSVWNIINGSSYPFLQWQGSPAGFNYPPSSVPPSNLTATPHNGYISLTWQAPSMGSVSYYYIYRNGSLFTSTSSNNYDDGGLTNYTTYTYKVTAIFSGESNPSNEVSTFPHTGFAGGDGSVGNPYLVSNAGELHTVRLYLETNFKQIADIELGTYPWNYSEGWEPIYNFTGTYDGNGFNINNLFINKPSQETIGLFGSIDGGTVDNVTINSANITGSRIVGILTGQASNCFLTNIKTNGTVNGGDYTGGISASTYQVKFNKCSSSGTISATGTHAGGFSGDVYGNSSITNGYSNMSVNSSAGYVGGLAGSVELKSTITNSYFNGYVSGSEVVGGIVGLNDSSEINTCYSIAAISGSSYSGGLAGWTQSSGTVANSYWNTETSGQSTSPGGGEGRTTSAMQYPYSNTFVGWDFTNVWTHDNSYTVNNGYPYLRQDAATIPTVTTNTPDSYTSNSAIIKGNVTADGGLTVTARGMVWSTSSNPTIESNNGMSIDGQGLGEFTSTLTNLTSNIKYYVKAYATNTLGTGYGNEVSFTTSNTSGSLTITGNSSVCQGARGVAYSISGSFTSISWTITNGTIASGASTNNIKVNWNNSGNTGIVEVQTVNSGSIIQNGSLNVTMATTSKPDYHIKGEGRANIIICLTAGANSYQWYKDGNAITSAEGKKQYYVASTNIGTYYVGVDNNNGCIAFSDNITIGNLKSLNLYPNPASGITTLSYEGDAKGTAIVRIVDVYGKTVKQLEWYKPDYQLQENIPLNGLHKGVYMIEITVEGVIMENQRFIIN